MSQAVVRAYRRLSLLGVFLLVSAGILAVGGVGLGAGLSRALRAETVDQARRSAEHDVDRLLRASVVRDGRVQVTRRVPVAAQRSLARRQGDIISVKVWRPDATLAWTQIAPRRIGHRYPMTPGLGAALHSGTTSAEFVSAERADDRAKQAVQEQSAPARLLEVYTPIRGANGRPIGAYEVYVDARPALDEIAAGRRSIWLATAAVFALLWAALALLVRGASRRLRRQTRLLREHSAALADAYRALEQRSVEAIESLNATIEARDPSGAGRSARVQRLALAIASELGLDDAEWESLARAALLHDIGNIAVPDAVLVKPGGLTAGEYEQVKLHAEEGAAILDRLSPLSDAVPIVRHHHERWDGSGYPDGLAGAEIPHGAAIVAVAEAWTAMTSDRPYRWAMAPDEAVGELLAGRGTQFSPVVVDAFLRAAGDHADELWLRPARPVMNAHDLRLELLSDR